MAFQNKLHDVPRDLAAIDQRSRGSAGLLTGTVVLLIIVVVGGFFLLSTVGGAPTERTINAPTTTELSPSAPQPATQPTPTP